MKNTLRKILCTAVSSVMILTTASAASYSTVYDINDDNEYGYTREGVRLYSSSKLPLEAKVINGRVVTAYSESGSKDIKNRHFLTKTVADDYNCSSSYYDLDEDSTTLPEAQTGRLTFKMNYISGFEFRVDLKDVAGSTIAKVPLKILDSNITINDTKIWSQGLVNLCQPEQDTNIEIILDYDKKRIFLKLYSGDELKVDTENPDLGANSSNLIKYTNDGTVDAENGTLGIPFTNFHPVSAIDFMSTDNADYSIVGNTVNYLSFDNVSLSYYDPDSEETTEGFTDTFDISDVSITDYKDFGYSYDESTYYLVNKMDSAFSYNVPSANTEFQKKFGKVTDGKLVAEFFFRTADYYPYYHAVNFIFRSGSSNVATMKSSGGPTLISAFSFNDSSQATVSDENVKLGFTKGYGGATHVLSLFRFVFDLDNNSYDAYALDTDGNTYKLNTASIPFVTSDVGIDNLVISTWAPNTKTVSKLKIYTIDEKSGNPEFANAGVKIDSVSKSKDTVLPIYTGFIPEVTSASLIVAAYGSDGSMKKVDIFDDELTLTENEWDLEKIEYQLPADLAVGDTIRVFVWDSVAGLVPYSGGSQISVVK